MRRIWVYRPGHPAADAHGFVNIDDLGRDYHEEKRVDVLTDRYMEGTASQDGVDIGSRGKRKEYMKRNDLADYDDFKGVREEKAKERERFARGDFDRKARREVLGRELYKKFKQ